MVDFLVRIADLTIAVQAMHDLLVQQSLDYLLPSHGFEEDSGIADIAVRTCQADIDHERAISGPGDWDDAYLETLAIFRHIAEQLPARHRLVFHGATIAYQGQGLVFTAPSGTGKTTHIRLWKRTFGDDVHIINGDKPILHVDAHHTTAYGTPWAGKEHWQRNTSVPVAGICVVTRATSRTNNGADHDGIPDERGILNSCTRLSPAQALPLVLAQTYMPSNPQEAGKTLDMLDVMLSTIPVYRLSCTISTAAVQASAAAMLHGNNPSH